MIILFSGPPAAGKSTLASLLTKELKIPCISKDEIKELLFDNLGQKDVEWSQKLGATSFEMIAMLIKKFHNLESELIVDCNFNPDGNNDWLKEYKPIEIFVTAPNDLLIKRFQERWNSGERHRGHVDDLRFDELSKSIASRNKRLNISDNFLEVSNTENHKDVLSKINDFLALKLN